MNKEIKQENRRALPKFVAVVAGAFLLGVLLSVGAQAIHSRGVEGFSTTLRQTMEACAAWIIPVLLLAVNLPCGLSLRRCEKDLRAWNGEDEVLPDRVEQRINYVLLFSNISYLVSMLVLSLVLVSMENVPTLLIVLAEFIAAQVVMVLQQKKSVDLVKTMNPEKRGSVLDMNFQKKWMDSCDENERKRVGEASYAAYWTVNVTCIVLWVLLIFVDQVIDVGAIPFFLLLTILGASMTAYCMTEIKANRRRRAG